MGLKDPVGKQFSPWGDKKGKIIGVVEDFHFESLHSGVEPMLLLPLFDNPSFIIVRINPENFAQTIDKIKISVMYQSNLCIISCSPLLPLITMKYM